MPNDNTTRMSSFSNENCEVLQDVSFRQRFYLTSHDCQSSSCHSQMKNSLIDAKNDESSFPNSHPTILKKSLKDKKQITGNSPVKSLTFSPSKFLNAGLESLHKAECNISKDVICRFEGAEDSGIVISDLSSTVFTSTPQRKCIRDTSLYDLQTSLNLSNAENSSVFVNPLQSTPKNNNTTNENQTPVIQKFLSESVLQTPSPFKCPVTKCNISDDCESSSLKSCKNYVQKPFKKSAIQLPKKHLKSCKNRTVRKALIHDNAFSYECKKSRKSQLKKENFPNSILKFSSLPIKGVCKEFHDRSNLIEQSTMVEKRKVTPVKSVFYTRKLNRNSSTTLSKQWVSVACGQTSDQKDMVAAALRCLYQC